MSRQSFGPRNKYLRGKETLSGGYDTKASWDPGNGECIVLQRGSNAERQVSS